MRLPRLKPILSTAACLMVACTVFTAVPAMGVVTISEIRADQPSTDNDEFFELAGTPGESLAGLTYITIGDGSGTYCGTIEAVVDLNLESIGGPLDTNPGFFVAAEASFTLGVADLVTNINFENSDNITHLLVSGFTGLAGDDLDTNDDGVLDVTPWTSIVDEVALSEGTVPDCLSNEYLYSTTVVGPDGSNVPAHVSRCPGGWVISDYALGVNDTPGATNICQQFPEVNNVIHRSISVQPGATATVTADATDGDGTISTMNIVYQVNGGGYVTAAMSLVSGSSYSGTIPAATLGDLVEYYVEATDNDSNIGTNPSAAPATVYSYTVENLTITPIADVHANLVALTGSVVTVEGQVYCPGNYKADGSISAYIQDASGRGLNVFGSTFSTGGFDLNNTGNTVRVTGTVTTFGTTVELTSYEVIITGIGNPPLTPSVQPSTLAASAGSNEGTYIESTGVITDIVTTGTAGVDLAYNFTVTDCSGPVVFRIDEDVAPAASGYAVGDELTAAGAGGTFGGLGQIIVCNATDVTNNGFIGDLCSPLIVSARFQTLQQVLVVFDEVLDPSTATLSANYFVFEAGNPGNSFTLPTVSAVDGSSVLLDFAAPFDKDLSWIVDVSNVADLSLNTIAPHSQVPVLNPFSVEQIVITEIMQNPAILSDALGEWFEIRNDDTVPIDLEGWTIRDDGTDLHVISSGGSLVINPGEYKVFAVDGVALAAEGVSVFYEYADLQLGNSADELVLLNLDALEVDAVRWDGGATFPDPTGSSMYWLESGPNEFGINWGSDHAPPFGSGDLGTPGAANTVITATGGAPAATSLRQNYPNPFNPRTSFNFTLEKREHVSLRVYNTRGQLVRTLVNETLDAGSHSGRFSWDGLDDRGKQSPSGTYLFRLETASGVAKSGKMTLLK